MKATRRSFSCAALGVVCSSSVGRADANSPPIVAWGDSLTAGGYPALAAALFSPPRQIINRGVGGQGCESIAIRQGGVRLRLTLAGNILPEWSDADAPPEAPVTEKNNNILTESGRFAGSATGLLAGRRGQLLTDAMGNWRFRRLTHGPAISLPPMTVFTIDETVELTSCTQWIWAGRNDVSSPDFVNRVPSIIAQMASFIGHERYLIGSIINAADEVRGTGNYRDIIRVNEKLAKQYGRRFVDLRSRLVAADVDRPDAGDDVIPDSLRVDPIHLNERGALIVARAMAERTISFGW